MKQCTYNVTLRSIRATNVTVKSNKFYIFQKSVFVALGTQREMRMRHIVIRGPSGSTIFFHIISQKTRFLKKKKKLPNIKCVF